MARPATENAVDPAQIRFRPGHAGRMALRCSTAPSTGTGRAYVRAGKGPALLLIHGIGDSSDSWRPVLKELSKTHTVIAPDLLEHGRSEKPRAHYSVAAYANGMRDLTQRSWI